MKKDVGREEKEVFAAYLAKHRLKRSEQREAILDAFLRSEQPPLRGRPAAARAEAPARRRPHHRLPHAEAAAGRGAGQELVLRGRDALRARVQARSTTTTSSASPAATIFEFSSDEIERIQDEIAAEHRLRDRRPPPPDLRLLPRLRRPARRAPRAEARRSGVKLDRIEVRRLRLPLLHPVRDLVRPHHRQGVPARRRLRGRRDRLRRVRGRHRSLLPARDQRHRRSTSCATSWCRWPSPRPRPPARRCGPALARVRGHEMAKAALEMAVWELQARREGVPAARAAGRARRDRSRPASPSGLQDDDAALVRTRRGGGRGRLPAHQDQDQARAATAASVARGARALSRRCP